MSKCPPPGVTGRHRHAASRGVRRRRPERLCDRRLARNYALVAVGTGLLGRTQREEAEVVLAHEIRHVANGDTVTLALIQGVANTFVIFLSRVVGRLVDRVVFKIAHDQGAAFRATAIIARLVFGILTSIIVLWFSRRREFRAGAGGARLAGHQNMIAAAGACAGPRSAALAGSDGQVRYFRQHRPRCQALVHAPSAAGSAHCGAAVGGRLKPCTAQAPKPRNGNAPNYKSSRNMAAPAETGSAVRAPPAIVSAHGYVFLSTRSASLALNAVCPTCPKRTSSIRNR